MKDEVNSLPGITIEAPPTLKKTGVKGPVADEEAAAVSEATAHEFNGDSPAEPDPKVEDKDEEGDIDQAISDFKKNLGYYPEDKKKPEVKETDDEKKTDKAEGEPAKAKPDKTEEGADASDSDKPDKSKRRPVQGGLSVEEAGELVRTAADAAADAAVRAARGVDTARGAAPSGSDPAEALSEDDRLEYSAFQQLEGDNPKYKGISSQYVKFVGELDRYRSTWEKDHPDTPFDPDSGDHDQFYDRHQPKYSTRDLEAAKINMAVEARMGSREKEISDRHAALEAKVAEYELRPSIERQAGAAVQQLVEAADPEAAKLLAKGAEALQEEDPIAFDVLDEAASGLRVMVGELEKLTHKSGLFKFDPKNQLHVHLDNFAQGLEADIRRRPAEERVRDGRTFATKREMESIPPDRRGNYWVLDGQVIREELVKVVAKDAASRISKEKSRIAKYTKSAAKTPPDKGSEARERPATKEKNNSPASTGESISGPAMTHGNAPSAGPSKMLMDNLFPV